MHSQHSLTQLVNLCKQNGPSTSNAYSQSSQGLQNSDVADISLLKLLNADQLVMTLMVGRGLVSITPRCSMQKYTQLTGCSEMQLMQMSKEELIALAERVCIPQPQRQFCPSASVDENGWTHSASWSTFSTGPLEHQQHAQHDVGWAGMAPPSQQNPVFTIGSLYPDGMERFSLF
jgi:hypothetical protein